MSTSIYKRRPSRVACRFDAEKGWVGGALVGSMGDRASPLSDVVKHRSTAYKAMPVEVRNASKTRCSFSLEQQQRQKSLQDPEDSEQEAARRAITCDLGTLGDMPEEHEEEDEEQPPPLKLHAGLVIDFVSRHTTDFQQLHDPAAGINRQMLKDKKSMSVQFVFAVAFVNQEMLLSDIREDITYFWKELDDPAWRYEPLSWTKGIIAKRYMQIVKMKKEAVCLKAEVTNWLFRLKLLKANADTAETQSDRHARHQQFWAQLHEVPRKLELRETFKASDEKWFPSQENFEDVMPPRSPEKSLDVRNRSGNDLQWKARPARSRCAAGTWDWAQGSSDVPNQRGRTAGNVREPCGLWTFDEAPDFPSEQGVEASRHAANRHPATDKYESMPHFRWWKARQPDPFTGETPFVRYNDYPRSKSMTKSSSLPVINSRPVAQVPKTATLGSRPGGLGSHARGSRAAVGSSTGAPELASSASLPSLGFRTGTASRSGMGSRALMSVSTSSWRSVATETASSASLRTLASRGCVGSPEPLASEQSAFPVPWQGKSPIPTLSCQDSPTKRYLRAVKTLGSVPRPMPFVTGHSMSFDPGEGTLRDKDLDAVVDMMAGMQIKVEEVRLDGHMQLSEKPLTAFAKALVTPPASNALRYLSLQRCLNAGQLTCEVIVEMLHPEHGCGSLRHLDLSGIPIGSRRIGPLAQALGEHPALQTLLMADTGLGSAPYPEQCTCHILSNRNIQKLNLGWNCFTEEVFSAMGERLTEMKTLKSLSLANAASDTKHGYASPIVHFLEHLSRDYSLRYLDVSLNRMDFRSALVLEDALESHKNLTELNLSHNPLGAMGTRSILRLLSRNTSGLTYFTHDDCSTGPNTDATDTTGIYQVFSATNPGGHYSLELQRPYHRSLLRMLYKVGERFQLPPDQTFFDVRGVPPFAHASKDSHGVWVTPTKGTVETTFSIDTAVVDMITKDIDPYDFGKVLERYQEIMRVRPGFRKVIPLLAQWRRSDGNSDEQKVLLRALSQDFLFTYPHIELMIQSRMVLVDIIQTLLPCIEGGLATRHLTMTLVPTLGELIDVVKFHQPWFSLNLDNPNGHYKLDLEKASDNAVAENLILLDRWEAGIARKSKRFDTSQRGNFSQFRNEHYMHRPLNLPSIEDWKMPDVDLLEFDYSSGRRPPANAQALDHKTYSNILVALSCSDCSPKQQILALQMVSHWTYITCTQMRGMLNVFKDEKLRLDMIVIWFLRITDLHNEKVFRVQVEESGLRALRSRLGYVAMFPFIQPEQARFKLNLAHYEQRVCATILMNLSGKENPANLRDPSYVHEDGFVDPLTAGLPRAWEDLAKVPLGGTLSVCFMGSPEDMNFQYRKQVYQQYAYRKTDVAMEDVMWWAALREAPKDVLEYLQWITLNFSHPRDCFWKIDGPGGNGVVSLREFEESFEDLDCQVFKGNGKAKEMERIQSIFRYLDPSGEGQVSEPEWAILTSFWMEIKLCITEFVHFCIRMFGNDLSNSWVFMDADGSGEVSKEEWVIACRAVGYFGPVDPIFRYMDSDNQGTVSPIEFKKMEAFRPEEVKRTKHEPLSRSTTAARDESQRASVPSNSADSCGSASDSRPVSRGREEVQLQAGVTAGSDSRPSSRGGGGGGGTASAPGSRPVSRQKEPS